MYARVQVGTLTVELEAVDAFASVFATMNGDASASGKGGDAALTTIPEQRINGHESTASLGSKNVTVRPPALRCD